MERIPELNYSGLDIGSIAASSYDANTSGFLKPRHVKKPWGREQIMAENGLYVVKYLCINQGGVLSLQYHMKRMETLTMIEGVCRVMLGEENNLKAPVKSYLWDPTLGLSLHIKPRTIHRFEALTPVILHETSTTELEDEVRLQDNYGRK